MPYSLGYSLLDLIAKLDIIDRVEGWVSTFLNADWKGAASRGPTGLAGELGRCVVRSNTWLVHIDRRSGWSGVETERLLKRYGVKVWDRGFTQVTLWFRVKRRQANWAEYLLRRRGIPVVSEPFNPRNDLAWWRYQGRMPAPWDARENGWLDKLADGVVRWLGE